MGLLQETPSPWWSNGPLLRRFVTDLVAGELSRLRPGATLPPQPWDTRFAFTGAELSCDSHELVSLATALVEALQMQRAGIEDYLLVRRSLADWIELSAASLDRFSAQLVFRTSGSSGEPKSCRHSLAALDREVAELGSLLPDCRRIVCAVPAHHIYGFLFTVLLPHALGVEVLDVRSKVPASVAALLRDGDVVVAHPVFWEAFARLASTKACVVGVTSTSPCPPELAKAIVVSGISKLIQIYGSSETGGLGWRACEDDDFRLFEFWRRSADDGTLSRMQEQDSASPVIPPDRLVWTGDETFQVVGRRDAAVQVGGINVFPDRVARRLCQRPGVAQAAVRLMRPHEGARLKAFVAPSDPSADVRSLREELTRWCDANLSVPERPKAFDFGPGLPSNGEGKSADWPVQMNTPYTKGR